MNKAFSNKLNHELTREVFTNEEFKTKDFIRAIARLHKRLCIIEHKLKQLMKEQYDNKYN